MQMEKEESNPSSSKGICEKLFSAFSTKPSFRSSRSISCNEENNRVPSVSASNLSTPLPSQASKDHDAKPLGPQNILPSPEKPNWGIQFSGKLDKKKEAEVVPIEFLTLLPSPSSPPSKDPEKTSKPLVSKEKEQVAKKIAKGVEETSPQAPVHRKEKRERKSKSKKNVESAPTAGRVVLKQGTVDIKEKVETTLLPSSEVEDRKKEESDNINDKASDYIRRAKLKIRTTSSAGVASVGRAISLK